MAKKKKEVELKEVSRKEINGAIIITYEDGSVVIIPAPIKLTKEEAEELFGSEEDDDEEEEEDDEEDSDDEDEDDSDDDEEEEDDDEDSDDFDEDDIEKLRKAIAKELGLKLPAKKEAKGKGKKGKK